MLRWAGYKPLTNDPDLRGEPLLPHSLPQVRRARSHFERYYVLCNTMS